MIFDGYEMIGRPDKSAVIFKYDGLGRRIEKCITRSDSEKIISLAIEGNKIPLGWQHPAP